MRAKAFGIDLGTTHSCIAHIDSSGKPVIVPNAVGDDVTPSVVYFEAPEQVLVGVAAKNSAVLAPHQVAQLVKRDMGSAGVSYTYFGRTYTPEEVSALVLKELARCGQQATGVPVRDVVITVPAHFGVAEREATRRAGQIAGLNVLDIIHEPVAAALHYGADDRGPGTRHVLVCDLGGGTYDTTVIRIEGDDIRVLCTDGDPRLGGADWDARIRDYLIDSFTDQHPRLDPRADEEFGQDVAQRAELLKKELSRAVARQTELRFAGAAARVELTRERLEELTADLFDRVIAVTERTLAKARRHKVDRFDEVLLVGGMTRVPAVARLLRERLELEARPHEPDLAVAKGAALFAVLHSGAPATEVADELGISRDRAESLTRTTPATVVPRGIGVKAVDPSDPMFETDPMRARQVVWHLLTANTPLPADSKPYPFAVVLDNQRMVQIEVWEQSGQEESMDVAANSFVGKGFLRDLPPRPAGSPFSVRFYMSETGTLTVHAEEPESGAKVRFDLEIAGMTGVAVDEARAGIARHRVSG